MMMDNFEKAMWEEFKTDRFVAMLYMVEADECMGDDTPKFETLDSGLAQLMEAYASMGEAIATLKTFLHKRRTDPHAN